MTDRDDDREQETLRVVAATLLREPEIVRWLGAGRATERHDDYDDEPPRAA